MKPGNSNTLIGTAELEGTNGARTATSEAVGAAPSVQPDWRDTSDPHLAQALLLWEHRRFLARATGIGLLLSTAIAFLIPNRYQSLARLMPPDSQSGSGLAMAAAALTGAATGTGGSVLGGLASDLLGTRSNSDLLAGVLTSHTVEDKVIQRFDLKKVYKTRRIEDTRKALENWTDVSVDRKNQIITIKVTDLSAPRAAAIAGAYIEELNQTVASVSTSSARRERIFLEGRLQSVNRDLEAAEKEFSRFASKNETLDIKEQGKAMLGAAAKLQAQLSLARSQLQGLRQAYAESNIRVRTVEARIAQLQEEMAKFDGQYEGAAVDGEAPAGDAYPSLRRLPLLGVPYADLYRATMVQEAVFETLTKQYELAKVQEAKEIPTVKVLDPPFVPEKKSFPPHLLLVLLGTTFTFSLAAAWIFGCTKWDLTDPSNPRKVLAQEILATAKGTIPWASRNGHGRK